MTYAIETMASHAVNKNQNVDQIDMTTAKQMPFTKTGDRHRPASLRNASHAMPATPWERHKDVAESVLSPGQSRDYLYREEPDGTTNIRRFSDALEIPASGETVVFRIRYAPNLRGKHKSGAPIRRSFNAEIVIRQLTRNLDGALSDVDLRIRFNGLTFDKPTGKHAYVRMADVIGTAVVVNSDRLLEVMQTGIGQARAYGCGMLQIKPLALSDSLWV